MTSLRTYGDACGIARALDIVGERWALLVVRELVLGPKRFTDLRAGLPAASPNVLAQRLRELDGAGVISRRKLGPPAASWVYELTDWGRELEPVLLALGRWGTRVPPAADVELGVDAFLLALRSLFDPELAGELRASVGLRLGDEGFALSVAGGRFDLARGEPSAPDAVIDTDVATMRALAFGRRDLGSALSAGEVRIDGNEAVARRLLRLFPVPPPLERVGTDVGALEG